mgnify:CR=1 FL=1
MILACHNISKAFGDQIIVKSGTFHIEEREKAALIGLNGAGKSTTMRHIMGFSKADDGNITINSLDSWQDKEKIKEFIAFCRKT